MFKRISFILAVLLLSIVGGKAQNVEVSGIEYTISGNRATVAQGNYSGNLIIPESIEVDGAFYDVVACADRCFRGSSDLESITFEGCYVDFLGVATFENCPKLKFINMPQQSSQIGEWSFAGCPVLQSINIPEGITTLANAMFKNCVGLTEVTLPATMGNLYIDVFYNTPSLKTVFLNSESAPTVRESPITSGATVVIPDGFRDGYSSTWCGAIVMERSDYEHPSSYTTLKTYIDLISESGISYEPGTAPGAYPEDVVEEFETALINAILLLDGDYPEETYISAYEELVALKEKLDKSFNPITDGYYYIISSYSAFVEKQGVEKAMTVNGDKLAWGTIEKDNPMYVFHIVPLGNDTYSIQNFATGKYVDATETASASRPVMMSMNQKTAQTITPIGNIQWLIANKFCNISYHPESHASGDGLKGNIVTYNDNKINDKSTWYLAYVDPSDMEALTEKKDQIILNTKLELLIDEAKTLSEKTMTYKTEKVELVADDDPAKSQIISNAKDPAEGSYAALTDGDITGDIFFHSTYHEDPGVPHYLQITLPQPISGFNAFLARRSGVYGYADAPTSINVYATNNVEGDWTFIKNIRMNWPNEGTVVTPNVILGADYSFLRLEIAGTVENRHNAGCEHPFFTLAELELRAQTLDTENSQYYYMEGLKAAVDKMLATADGSQVIVAESRATQADVDALRADIDAVLALFVDTTALNRAIITAETYVEKTKVGEDFGQTTEEALSALSTALASAKQAALAQPLVKANVDNATKQLTQAINEFLKSIKGITPDTWYFIKSVAEDRMGEAGEDDAFCYGSVIYAQGNNDSDHLLWGLNEGQSQAYHYNPYAMWRFLPIEGTTNYAVQNMGNGFYMGKATSPQGSVKVSYEPVPYIVNFLGGGQFELIPANDGNELQLHAKGANNNIVTYDDGGYKSASAWTFEKVEDSDDMLVYTGVLYNFTDVICLPYAHSDIMNLNDDVQTLAVKKMTQEMVDDELVTTVELYEKTEFEAGEPFIIWIGDPEQEYSDYEIILPFPTDITDIPGKGNGLAGCLHGEGFPAGTAFSTGHGYVAATDGVGIGAQTGVIDPATYTGEVKGVPTALTLTLKGLRPLPSAPSTDVNGDGKINSTDVVAVYNYIQIGNSNGMKQETYDVNGDGKVNSADIVAIYNAIIGSTDTKSRAYKYLTKLFQAM